MALCTLVFMATPAIAQDCTGPDGTKGDLIYNSTHKVFQGCTARGWMAFHEIEAVSECMTTTTVGTACPDGQTVYAGTWGGNRYYTTVADQTVSDKAHYGAYFTALGANAQSTTDGLLNTNTAITSIEANPQVVTCGDENDIYPFNPPACTPNAHLLCKELRTTLGGNWYLPAREELINVLYANRVAIGGFSTTASDYYWSSSETGSTAGVVIQFSNGSVGLYSKDLKARVRCVRK